MNDLIMRALNTTNGIRKVLILTAGALSIPLGTKTDKRVKSTSLKRRHKYINGRISAFQSS